MNDLGKALLSKVDSIIDAWIDEVRHDEALESNRGLTYEAVRDGLPKVLSAVATLLTSAFVNETIELEAHAIEHGEIRAEQGFDVAEVVHEYRVLRNILISMLEPDLATGSVSEALKAVRKINDVLDDVLMTSLECYVQRKLSLLDQMQGQMLLTNQELLRLVQAQKDDVSHLAHELKNPLNSIIAFSSILLRRQRQQLTQAPDKAMEMQQIERILNNGRQLLRLINNTLEVSRNESAQVSLRLEQVAVTDLVKMVVEAFEPSVVDKPVVLEWDCDLAPKTVTVDGLRLQQILTNLISNAIRYTSEGSVKVTCYTKRDLEEGFWAIAVRDTGKGISPEYQSKIVEPYFRVGDKKDYLPESSGLGLTVVSKLVALFQGRLKIESKLGKGSTFTVILPLSVEALEGA
ncbi:MAG: HAMP domain-containing sensor histidine kinase [Phormidesmis sp.]